MQTGYSDKYKLPIHFLNPGEYYATDRPEILSTMLGSCISVCLIDERNQIGGMNHFMLPGCISSDEILISEIGRYGLYAMELLIGEIIKKGGDRKAIKGRCFGGGAVLRFRQSDGDVPEANIRFIRKYFELEGIPLIAEDLGGAQGRKIYFFVPGGRVLLKRFKDVTEELIQLEKTYKGSLFRKRINPSFPTRG
jgi:chemotaxis protein CheD